MTGSSGLTKFARFLLVGGLGFVVDAGGLLLLTGQGADPFVARLASIALAMLVTWRLNRSFTFGPSRGSQLGEATRYLSVALSVAALNYTIYALLLLAFPGCPPVVATAVSTGICTLASFVGYGRVAFRAR